MAKKYNLSSKSDMRRFERDLKSNIMDKTRHAAQNGTYNVTCPHCSNTVQVHAGVNRCPYCGNTIDLKLNINF